jgi:hypothetical protein
MSAPYDYKVANDKPADDTMCQCGDCGAVNRFVDLKPIGDCSLTPGDPSPAGRCSECESLSYVVKPEPETATEDEIARARDQYALGSSDNIEIDDNALVSRGDEGCFVQAWVWLPDDEAITIERRRNEMHEWGHHEEIRRTYKSKRFEIVDNELVGNISYYLVYRHSFPAGLRFHYMSDNPDFSCAYDDLAEVGEPFQPWFIAAMNRYNEKKKA